MNQAASRYLFLLVCCTTGLATVLAGFNAFIDPYGYFEATKVTGVNEKALGFNHRLPLAKSLAVSRLRPATIILGNSRAETGYDPEHPGFGDQPAYNLAIGGAGLGQIRRYFLEALATGELRHVFLTLDLTMFDPSLKLQEVIPGPVLITDEAGNLKSARKWNRLLFILLSGTATSDSWWSLSHQRKPVATYRSSGLKEDSYDNEQVLREGGHRSASIRAESSFLTNNLRDVISKEFVAGYANVFAKLHEIIALASERNIRLTLVINPIHARQTYMFAASGLWATYAQWKRDLVASTEQSPKTNLVSLWDFSGVSPCTAESIPENSSSTLSMRWYRESSHFNRQLGDRVLNQVFGNPVDSVCPGLVMRLVSSTLEPALAAQHAALKRWISTHPGDVEEIDTLARKYGRGPAIK